MASSPAVIIVHAFAEQPIADNVIPRLARVIILAALVYAFRMGEKHMRNKPMIMLLLAALVLGLVAPMAAAQETSRP